MFYYGINHIFHQLLQLSAYNITAKLTYREGKNVESTVDMYANPVAPSIDEVEYLDLTVSYTALCIDETTGNITIFPNNSVEQYTINTFSI